MKKLLIAALLCAGAGAANATVLNFDDIKGVKQDSYGPLVGSYAGYTFGTTGEEGAMYWIDTVTKNDLYNRGAVSGDFTLLNNDGGAAVIKKADGSQFTFGGVWAENWLSFDTSSGSLAGYKNGNLVWTTDVTLAGEAFSYFVGAAGNIDELRLDFGGNFLVDNLALNERSADVPLPATPALMGIGLTGLGLLRRKSRA